MIYEKYYGEERKEMLDKYYLSALDLLINNYVIEQAAAREGVRVSSREISGAIDDIMKKNNVDEEKLKELLAASNQTLEQYKWQIKIDILKARLMSTVFMPKIIITDDDIDEYIMNNSEALDLSDMYELRIMTVDNDAELKEAMADFEKNGSFRDTAMKYSKSGNADSGGYLGWIELSFLDAEIRDVISGIKKGGIAKPIKGDSGYRVFFVEGFKNKSDVDDDKRNKIVASMQEKQSVEIFANWLAEKKERDTYPEKI